MVWTQESFKSVKYDRPGECSPEKDCLWWHWLTFQQPDRKSSLDSDDDFHPVSQCHHKQSFSGLHSPGRSSYYTDLWNHSLSCKNRVTRRKTLLKLNISYLNDMLKQRFIERVVHIFANDCLRPKSFRGFRETRTWLKISYQDAVKFMPMATPYWDSHSGTDIFLTNRFHVAARLFSNRELKQTRRRRLTRTSQNKRFN